MSHIYAYSQPAGAELIYPVKTALSQTQILFHYICHTLPIVNQRLNYWKKKAEGCVDEELRKQALNSIAGKDFHCQGGAVSAVPYQQQEENLINIVVAYQTLCDYLDNLCDRANCLDGEAFRQLHYSLIDALTPGTDKHNYYVSYPFKDDGGYIDELVLECRQGIARLPSYRRVYKEIIKLAQLYIDLQVYKHISWDVREKALLSWARGHLGDYPEVRWNEFAAASGSTLALFALLGLAAEAEIDQREVQSIVQAYFPWICGLHILLDYYIDQAEDRDGGDLNFTFYYADDEEMMARLKTFIREAHRRAICLEYPSMAKTVIEGLLAMYFSDKKVSQQGFRSSASELIKVSGRGAVYTYYLCSLVRKFI